MHFFPNNRLENTVIELLFSHIIKTMCQITRVDILKDVQR